MENKNSIVLTVIAVATLIVAVVGATFAYFQAQGGDVAEANITVNTGTAGIASFGTFDAINIEASQSNFAIGGTDVSKSSTGTVSWTAPGASGTQTPSESDRTFCYTVDFIISSNTFTKSAANTSKLNELEFSAVKGTTTIIDKMTLVNLTSGNAITGTINIPTASGGNTLKHTLTAEAGASVSDSWKFTVTLKNQNFVQNDNAGKSFSGKVQFTKVTC